jgi:hypothetical protein
MKNNNFTAKEVEITAVYFRSHNLGFDSYPRRMLYEGREYNFIEESLRYLIKTKDSLIQLFDVSDGQLNYRLRQDHGCWTLVNINSGA